MDAGVAFSFPLALLGAESAHFLWYFCVGAVHEGSWQKVVLVCVGLTVLAQRGHMFVGVEVRC